MANACILCFRVVIGVVSSESTSIHQLGRGASSSKPEKSIHCMEIETREIRCWVTYMYLTGCCIYCCQISPSLRREQDSSVLFRSWICKDDTGSFPWIPLNQCTLLLHPVIYLCPTVAVTKSECIPWLATCYENY